MAVLKPRNRLFLIRLTQDEYDSLKTACVSRGARNISDFARTLLLTGVGNRDGEAGSLAEVCRVLSGLQEEIGRMAERIYQKPVEVAGSRDGERS